MTELYFYSITKHKKTQSVPKHRHSCYELVFYGSGSSGKTVIGDKEYHFKAGDLTLIAPEIYHDEVHNSDCEVFFFGFDTQPNTECGLYRDMWHIKPIIDSIIKEAKNQEHGYTTIISLKLDEILTYIKRKKYDTQPSVKNLSFCKSYIEENYMYRIRVDELAKMSGYSSDYFRHLFTDRFNISPQGYLIEIRIKNAVRLLRNTDMNCTAIAYACGFTDSAQLTKMIKKKYKITPLQLRKRNSEFIYAE